MASEVIEMNCPNCGVSIKVPVEEFIDVKENEEYKQRFIDRLSERTASEIDRLGATKAYICGGEFSVSNTVKQC